MASGALAGARRREDGNVEMSEGGEVFCSAVLERPEYLQRSLQLLKQYELR